MDAGLFIQKITAPSPRRINCSSPNKTRDQFQPFPISTDCHAKHIAMFHGLWPSYIINFQINCFHWPNPLLLLIACDSCVPTWLFLHTFWIIFYFHRIEVAAVFVSLPSINSCFNLRIVLPSAMFYNRKFIFPDCPSGSFLDSTLNHFTLVLLI